MNCHIKRSNAKSKFKGIVDYLDYIHLFEQVREINGIELLLDCSPIDGKNPFISQWVIFAIRNIILDNHENQAVISSVSKDGQMDKKVLNDIGVDIQNM